MLPARPAHLWAAPLGAGAVAHPEWRRKGCKFWAGCCGVEGRSQPPAGPFGCGARSGFQRAEFHRDEQHSSLTAAAAATPPSREQSGRRKVAQEKKNRTRLLTCGLLPVYKGNCRREGEYGTRECETRRRRGPPRLH